MKVVNCKIDCSKTLAFEEGDKRQKNHFNFEKLKTLLNFPDNKSNNIMVNQDAQPDIDYSEKFENVCPKSFEYFFPTLCRNCNIEVGVFDLEQKVFHLFNVLPSLG